LSVGAVIDRNEGDLYWNSGGIDYSSGADRIVSFSQRSTGEVDIFAPGVEVTGASETGGASSYSGTSQAAPHITGIVALAQQLAQQQIHRKLTPVEFRSLLQSTAATIVDGDDEDDNVVNTGASYHRVDVYALANAIYGLGSAPELISITSDGGLTSSAPTLTFTAKFSEEVTGVDASDFVPQTTGPISFSGISVTRIDRSSFKVEVTGVTGQGTIALRVNDDRTIVDVDGQGLSGQFDDASLVTLPVSRGTNLSNDFVTTADLNSDRIADLLTSNQVFLGTSSGTFTTPITFDPGSGYGKLTVGDINNDSKPDIVGISLGSSFITRLGNGDGTFQTASTFDLGTGSSLSTSDIAIANVLGNGNLDVVVSLSGSSIRVVTGNGNGTFQAPRSFSVGSDPRSLTVADLNSDGREDIITGNFLSNDITVLLGTPTPDGAGTFASPVTLPVFSQPNDLAVADFNGDSNPDLAVASIGGNAVSLLLGNGDGTFQPLGYAPAGYRPTSIASTDIDQDGLIDLLLTNGDAKTTLLRGYGNGSFSPIEQYSIPAPSRSIAVADFNRDGRQDTVTSNNVTPAGSSVTNSTLSLIYGNPDGSLRATRVYSVDGAPTKVATGDFNRDGVSDILTPSQGSAAPYAVSYLQGRPDGSFEPSAKILIGTGAADSPRDIAIGDFNRDGNLDFVTANPAGTGNASLLLGNGDGTFQVPTQITTSLFSSEIDVGDVNGDGNLDLVSGLKVFLGNGDGTFQTPLPHPTISNSIDMTLADINNDGKLDLISMNGLLNSISTSLGNGDGTFQPWQVIGAGMFGFPNSAATGDFNRDGKMDLAVINGSIDTIGILMGNGDGTFQPQVQYPVGMDPLTVRVLNTNGDGRFDLVVTNSTSNTVSLLEGRGDGTFGPSQQLVTGNSPKSLIPLDVNRDGRTDLAVVTTRTSSEVSLLRRQSQFIGTMVSFTGAPEITVDVDGFNLNDGWGVSFGSRLLGSEPPVRTFRFRNTGSNPLVVNPLQLTGTGFSLVGSNFSPNQVISPGSSASIQIRMETSALGSFNASISLITNDNDENPFDVSLGGNVFAYPEIDIRDQYFGAPTTIPDGTGTMVWGNVPQGSAVGVRTLAVHNTGLGNLVLQPATITAGSGFSIVNNFTPGQVIAPGGVDWITLALDSTTAGPKTATLSLPNNDLDENPYDFALTASVVPPPVVTIIDDGDAGYSTVGTWSVATSGFQNDRRLAAAGAGNAVSTWTFSNLLAGEYRISATWNNGASNRANDARFTATGVVGGPLLLNTTVNQRVDPVGFSEGGATWQNLGNVTITGNTLLVNLANTLTGLVTADAIRIERLSTAPVQPSVGNILDDGDAGFSLIGTWMSAVGGIGNDHQLAPAGNGTSAAVWNYTNLTPGRYRIATTWVNPYSGRADNAPYTVSQTPGGPALLIAIVNQRFNPATFQEGGILWHSLGEVTLFGNTLSVRLDSTTIGEIVADAIRIERVGEPVAIVDDGDAGFSVNNNALWGSALNGYGNDRRIANPGAGNATATYQFNNLAPGLYRIATTWFSGSNRGNNIPYTVSSTVGGSVLQTFSVNQQVAPTGFSEGGVTFQNLGTINTFGNSLVVTIANTTAGNVNADAIRLERIGNPTATSDDGDAGFVTTGTWQTTTAGYGNDRRLAAAGNGTATATCIFSGLAAGQYRVFATWNNPATNRTNAAPFAVAESVAGLAAPLLSTTVNQQVNPVGITDGGSIFQNLGTVTIVGSTLVVRLSNSLGGLTTADAIRIERIG
jgi:FG-GAP-like repeat/Subtilase family/Protein of unknown function (DUF1573)